MNMQHSNISLQGRWTLEHDGELPTVDKLLEELNDALIFAGEQNSQVYKLESALKTAELTIAELRASANRKDE